MGHFAGLSGPSSRWREEAGTAAACWLLAALFGWRMRRCRAEREPREAVSLTALRDPFLEKKKQIHLAVLSYCASEQNLEVSREVM